MITPSILADHLIAAITVFLPFVAVMGSFPGTGPKRVSPLHPKSPVLMSGIVGCTWYLRKPSCRSE